MKTIKNPGAMTRTIMAQRSDGVTVGLVPTLGCLHEGHMALIKKAKLENEIVAVSIFVNPTQFKPKAYAAYPRNIKEDKKLLVSAGVDFLFSPAVVDIYPSNFDTKVEVMNLAGKLEGKSIRWHYRAVTTVVAKLFNIIQPHRAYFGRKDAHQLALIKRMVADLNFPVKIVSVPTIREQDGLAHSSRNTLLSPEERRAASAIPKALLAIERKIKAGATDRGILTEELMELLASEPMIKVDFVAVVDADTLEPDTHGAKTLIHAAVIIGGKRLTDNRVTTSRRPGQIRK